MKNILIVVGILFGILLVTALVIGMWAMGTYNGFVAGREGVRAAWSQVENVYQRRSDLIPNYVEVVKGYAKHEKGTLEAVIKARAAATQTKIDANGILNNPSAFKQFAQAQGALSSALSRLMVVVERYPELKANENFMKLQDELAGTENRIAVERKRYNESAQAYNTAIQKAPGAFIANMFNFKPVEYFKAEKGAEKAPKVKF